jgi:hypothetical protein
VNAQARAAAAAGATGRGSERVVVVGSGPLAAEVARNLELVGVPAAVHHPGDFWQTLRLSELQDCYCAVGAGIPLAARRRLNALCQVAGVDFVCAATDASGITVETFPFGSDPGCACLECEAPGAHDGLRSTVPDPIASSVAGALAAAAALHCAGHGARRLHAPEVNEGSTLVTLARRDDCGACASPWRAPRIIRTRNRWTSRDFLAAEAQSLAAQVVRLSDAVVTACDCAGCGPVAELQALVGRPATEAAAIAACPRCGAASVRIETRDAFSLGELTQRFGRGPVPAKFALAEIGGTAVCFDLEAAMRDPGSPA